MMKLFTLVMFIFVGNAYAVNPGELALDFSLETHKGSTLKLSSLKGKYIILEWYNSGCPYVRKHYDSGNMQGTQKLFSSNNEVVWISIVSSASGKQGYLKNNQEALSRLKEEKSFANYLIRDVNGKIGKLYGAKTTPQIVIIDHQFVVQYTGAIDSIPTANREDISTATNYVTSAMNKVFLQLKPSPQKTRPYGCSVKY